MNKKNKTEKSGDIGKTGSITQTVIISTLTTILGIVLGYLGTRANAQAQIETAKINIYGPIYTTQTAEARIPLAVTSATPVPASTTSAQISIPISNIKVDGKTIGDAFEAENSRVGEYELLSVQDDNGDDTLKTQLVYFWDSPGAYSEFKGLPMRGIETTISIAPSESRYGQELIYCRYLLGYDSHAYFSPVQFIPMNQPINLVWDFTGHVDISSFSMSDEEQQIVYKALDILDSNGISFADYYQRNGEMWQWQKIAHDTYDPSKIEELSLICSVDATQSTRGKDPGKQFTFRGTVTFGDVIVFLYEQPSK